MSDNQTPAPVSELAEANGEVLHLLSLIAERAAILSDGRIKKAMRGAFGFARKNVNSETILSAINSQIAKLQETGSLDDQVFESKTTALMDASATGQTDVVVALLSAGASTGIVDSRCKTALDHAATHAAQSSSWETHGALRKVDAETGQDLIDQGVLIVTAKTRDGTTVKIEVGQSPCQELA